MPYKDPSVRRARDRERFHRRTAERLAAGLCPRCGKRPPEPGRSVCTTCGEKGRRAERAHNARLRAAGKPRRDRERSRSYERARSRRQVAERVARNLCARCGKVPPEPDRRMCEPCTVKRRALERARYAAGKAAGKLYGGRDPEARRHAARTGSRKRNDRRIARGLCMRCGRRPPAEGKTNCETCRDACRTARRELYEARRDAGLCGHCGGPTPDGGSRCAPCAVRQAAGRSPERKNAAARRRYAERKARGRCTDFDQRFNLGADTPIWMRFETKAPVDDILVSTSAGGFVAIQAKTTVSLSRNLSSRFGETVSQFVSH